MAEAQTEVEADPLIQQMEQLMKEFPAHMTRLSLRQKEIAEKAAAGELDNAAIGAILAELFGELHDTALSFQADIARLVHADWNDPGDEDEEEEDEDGEPESFLLPADAALLHRNLDQYHQMLDGMLGGVTDPEQKKQLTTLKHDCDAALDLVEEAGGAADDGGGDEADADDAESQTN